MNDKTGMEAMKMFATQAKEMRADIMRAMKIKPKNKDERGTLKFMELALIYVDASIDMSAMVISMREALAEVAGHEHALDLLLNGERANKSHASLGDLIGQIRAAHIIHGDEKTH